MSGVPNPNTQFDRSLGKKGLKRGRSSTDEESYGNKDSKKSRGFFYRAEQFSIYNPTMIENNYNTPVESTNLKSVFDILGPHVMPEAAVDSSARDTPPRCHPGTRKQIGGKLNSWLTDEHRLWNMIWLRGPAGTGKSAVAQTFAEYAVEQGHFGAAFFFSKANKRNNPRFALLTRQLVDNPLILGAVLRVQFKKLIIEPFRGLIQNPQESLLIVLNGLDECNGEDPQCELIRLVCEAAHEGNHTPFLWLICSRPEPHIVFTFSTLESSINCGRELLSLDAESRMDVDQYLREGLAEIYGKHQGGVAMDMGRSWPSDADFAKISNAASGLFIFASTVLRYIGDPEYADPEYQLQMLMGFIDKTQQLGAKSPWDALDLLYTCVLSDVPKHILPITLRILSFCLLRQDLFTRNLLATGDLTPQPAFTPIVPSVGWSLHITPDASFTPLISDVDIITSSLDGSPSSDSSHSGLLESWEAPELSSKPFLRVLPPIIPDGGSVLFYCNFLRLGQGAFYSAIRKLHAIMHIPPPEEAAKTSLYFHHASFKDYLQDKNRSGRFYLGGLGLYFDFAESCLFWAGLQSDTNNSRNGLNSSSYAQSFTWIPSSDDLEGMHLGIARTASRSLAVACTLAESDGFSEFLSQIRQCRFTNFTAKDPLGFVTVLVRDLHLLGPREELGDNFIRFEVCNTVDAQLLDHLRLLVGPTASLKPMEFPPNYGNVHREEVRYFFLGHGSDSRIVCCSYNSDPRCYILGTESQLSEGDIAQFRQHMDPQPRPYMHGY